MAKTKKPDEAKENQTKRYEYTVEELSSEAMSTDGWRAENPGEALVDIVLLHEPFGGAKAADIRSIPSPQK